MQQSKGYVIVFTLILTVVCGGLLAGVAEGLKPTIKSEEKLDKRYQVMSAVLGQTKVNEIASNEGKARVGEMFDESISGFVVGVNGETIEEGVKAAESVNPRSTFKAKKDKDKKYPVFEYKEGGKVTAYVLPLYGLGLWDEIWGYVALAPDMKTIKGITFGHKGETPGLGARITDADVQARFVGKKLYEGAAVVEVQKGEGSNYDGKPLQVDGLSGASMTMNGVNNMIQAYFKNYEPFFNKKS